jgi:hypothetical protein
MMLSADAIHDCSVRTHIRTRHREKNKLRDISKDVSLFRCENGRRRGINKDIDRKNKRIIADFCSAYNATMETRVRAGDAQTPWFSYNATNPLENVKWLGDTPLKNMIFDHRITFVNGTSLESQTVMDDPSTIRDLATAPGTRKLLLVFLLGFVAAAVAAAAAVAVVNAVEYVVDKMRVSPHLGRHEPSTEHDVPSRDDVSSSTEHRDDPPVVFDTDSEKDMNEFDDGKTDSDAETLMTESDDEFENDHMIPIPVTRLSWYGLIVSEKYDSYLRQAAADMGYRYGDPRTLEFMKQRAREEGLSEKDIFRLERLYKELDRVYNEFHGKEYDLEGDARFTGPDFIEFIGDDANVGSINDVTDYEELYENFITSLLEDTSYEDFEFYAYDRGGPPFFNDPQVLHIIIQLAKRAGCSQVNINRLKKIYYIKVMKEREADINAIADDFDKKIEKLFDEIIDEAEQRSADGLGQSVPIRDIVSLIGHKRYLTPEQLDALLKYYDRVPHKVFKEEEQKHNE